MDSGARCSMRCLVDVARSELARLASTVEEDRVLAMDTRWSVAAAAAVAAALAAEELEDGAVGARCSRVADAVGGAAESEEDPVARGEDDAPRL